MVAMLLLVFFWVLAIVTCGLFIGKVWWLPPSLCVVCPVRSPHLSPLYLSITMSTNSTGR